MMEKKGLEKEPLKWKTHPMKDSWKATAGAISAIVLAAMSVFLISGNLVFSAISLLILVFSLSPFFFPTEYQLGPDSISVKGPFSRKLRSWSYFRRYYPDRKGVFLSPFSRPSRLESFRGIYVRFGGGTSEEERRGIIELISSKVED